MAKGESYGYAIIQEVKARSGGKLQWTDGMLYPVLHRMEHRGLIKSRWGESETGRKRKYYSLKKDGKAGDGQAPRTMVAGSRGLGRACERSNMFDLEKSIADWRQQMLAAGIKTPVPLEELESHLREEIEQQMKSGLGGLEAFNSAVQKIGQARALKLEFKKAGIPVEMRFVQLAGIACAAVAGLFSLWILLVLLTVHEANLAERILGLAAVTSIILSWRCGHGYLPAISRRRVRAAIEAVCCLASVGGMILFIKVIPHFLGQIPVGQMLVSFLWVWTAMAILAGTVYGLEKTARKTNEQYV